MLFACLAVQGKSLHKVFGSQVVLVTHMVLHCNLLCSTSKLGGLGKLKVQLSIWGSLLKQQFEYLAAYFPKMVRLTQTPLKTEAILRL